MKFEGNSEGKELHLEESLKHEKKALRAKVIAGQLKIDALEEEVKKWLRAIPSAKLHLEEGRVYIQEIKIKPKLTKAIVLEAFSTVLSTKVQLKEGQMMMSWVRAHLEKIEKKKCKEQTCDRYCKNTFNKRQNRSHDDTTKVERQRLLCKRDKPYSIHIE
jgi:hypothetical protein